MSIRFSIIKHTYGLDKIWAMRRRRSYGGLVIAALLSAEFTLNGELRKGDSNQFFATDFVYPSSFAAPAGFRAHIRIEMPFTWPALPTQARSVQSLVSQYQEAPAGVPAFACVEPVETAADKLSALAWRVAIRDRQREK